ncbi:MAG: glycosyltransferase family 4 protein [Armatimonadota bacterium]|nr:glycosyltransferase family 4 protein [Armatimonadota bacterium]
MNVVMLTPAFHPRTGGVERHVRRVSEELAAMGHRVTVVTRAVPGAATRERLGAVDVVRIAGGIRAGITLLSQHRELLRQAHIIHCHDAYPFLYWYAPLQPILRLPRAFVTFHGYEAYPPPAEAIRRRRRVRRACAGALCAGGFIPRWYGTACDAVTYGGVDAPSQPPEETRREYALFVGRLERDAGILDYIRALGFLKRLHGIALPLEVCGDGSLRADAEALARQEGVDARFCGFVPDPFPHLRRARFALTAGYLAMWEAMACGALVVALYDNPLKEDYLRCFPAVAGESGVVTVCGSPAEAAQHLAWLLQHPEEMGRRIREGARMAAERSWRRVAEEYLALWKGGGCARQG